MYTLITSTFTAPDFTGFVIQYLAKAGEFSGTKQLLTMNPCNGSQMSEASVKAMDDFRNGTVVNSTTGKSYRYTKAQIGSVIGYHL